jgi:hypothetical protein
MNALTPDPSILTLINVLRVRPEPRWEVTDLQIEANRRPASGQPGSVPATVHRSPGGTTVAMHPRWRSRDVLDAAHAAAPGFSEHAERIEALAQGSEMHLHQAVLTCVGDGQR